MSRLANLIISVVFIFVHSAGAFAGTPKPSFASDPSSTIFNTIQTTTFKFQDIDGQDIQLSISDKMVIPTTDAIELIHKINSSTKQSLLISYEENLPIDPTSLEKSITEQDRLTFLIPFTTTLFMGKAKNYATEVWEKDKVGIVIVTFATAYDSFLWVHAEHLATDQKAFMVIFNTLMAGSFGLHKDLWTHMTNPIQSRLATLFSYANWFKSQPKLKKLATSFTASFILGLPIQLARFTILDLHNLTEAMQTVNFWGSTLAISLLFTFTSFSWSEQIFSVDEVKNPIAKAFLRRFMEIRQSLLGYLSPTGKIMQPETHGSWPVYISVAHGVAGLLFLIKSESVVKWIEKNKIIQNIYKWHQKAEDRILELSVGAGMYWQDCKSLLTN